MPDVKYLEKFKITIDPRAILYIQGYDVRHEPKPTMTAVINRAIEEALLLARPRALYGEFPIAELTEDSLLLHDGTCFSIGVKISSWWKRTRVLAVAVCSGAGVSDVQENFNRCKHCGLARCSYRRVSRDDKSGLQGPGSVSGST